MQENCERKIDLGIIRSKPDFGPGLSSFLSFEGLLRVFLREVLYDLDCPN